MKWGSPPVGGGHNGLHKAAFTAPNVWRMLSGRGFEFWVFLCGGISSVGLDDRYRSFQFSTL